MIDYFVVIRYYRKRYMYCYEGKVGVVIDLEKKR